jgi:hypothetical protein
MRRHVALVWTDTSEEYIATIVGVEIISELRIMLAVTNNWRTVWREHRFLQEPLGITSQKTEFFVFTAVRTSNPTPFVLLQSEIMVRVAWLIHFCSLYSEPIENKLVYTRKLNIWTHLAAVETHAFYINSLLQINKKQTPWPLVRERTIPTERPPLVYEI